MTRVITSLMLRTDSASADRQRDISLTVPLKLTIEVVNAAKIWVPFKFPLPSNEESRVAAV
jgi:hypothetical protein